MNSNDSHIQHYVQSPGFVFHPDDKMTVDRQHPSPSPSPRPRPATIYEGFSFCAGDEFGSMPSWETSRALTMQTPDDTMSRPTSMHQNLYPMMPMEHNPWPSKPYDHNLEMPHFDTDMTIGQAITTDEAIPILDLRFASSQAENGAFNFESGLQPRRMSGSSFTMSATGLSDMPYYEDNSAALSEAPSFSSEYPPPSNRNSLLSSTQLSPVASPRMTPQSRSEFVHRGRGGSPSPRPFLRSAPYNVENSSRSKRWSTGSYGTTSYRRSSPFVYHHTHDAFGGRMASHHSPPTIPTNQLPLNYVNLQAIQQPPYLVSHAPAFRNDMILPSQLPPYLPSNGFHHEPRHYESPHPLMSHGLMRMLQSNGDRHSLHGQFADLSDPPDLYSSLREEQPPPPQEDMNPSDPDLTPAEQALRFEGDLYTARWVRGCGNKKEGWCGICKPGRWLVLKNSAYWYDKLFTHGVSSATGNPFHEPQKKRRVDGSPDVWEGLCGTCNEWISMVSTKKKGTTWFRHAYKCHTHPKIKDAPKRRRESSHSRALAALQTSKHRGEQQRPVTPGPQRASGTMSRATTSTPTSVFPTVRHQISGLNGKLASQITSLTAHANANAYADANGSNMI